MLVAVDHVRPAGSEPRLRAFHEGVPGMTEIPKPPVLAARGGCRFAAGRVRLHLGVEAGFRPARKAHPGLRVSGIHDYAARLEKRGAPVVRDDNLPGHRRFSTQDPVGNRLEFPEPLE
ncbi:VOC family protein [Streptomyces roseicoloratus]|uniref:VOC family protein n=1 Tax=Streptomyces roseicoloratus TaxID=2508722 RepID=UPI001009C1FB|nr:VOC family protein [Streptomyces roseicoloratus]